MFYTFRKLCRNLPWFGTIAAFSKSNIRTPKLNFCNSGHFFLPASSSPAVLSSASAHRAGVCICVCETCLVSRTNTDAPTSVCCGSCVRPALSYLSTALWQPECMERTIWNFCCITRPLRSGLINYKCSEMTLSFSFYLFLSFLIFKYYIA